MSNNHFTAIVQCLWNYCNVLPDPDVLTVEIMEDLQAALAQFSLIVGETDV